MKNRFDWNVGDLEDGDESVVRHVQHWWQADAFWFMLGVVIIGALLIGGWRAGQAQLARSEAKLKSRVQTIFDLERQAILNGDGDLFLSVQDQDPAWLVAQLLPENLEPTRAGLQVTRAQSHDNLVWANVSWREGGQTWQRVSFLEWRENQLVHVPSDASYWGPRQRTPYSWGDLVYQKMDATYVPSIAAAVDDWISKHCAGENCPEGALPFTLTLTPDHYQTAATDEIRVPSPRLLALKQDGLPAPPFWRHLEGKIEAHLTPATIRFALPPEGRSMLNYGEIASEFMSAYPGIRVELVQLDTMPEDLSVLATQFDGAMVIPSAEMVASGLVHDLTDFAQTDADFNRGDFYEQLWQGAHWHERMWFMPQAASLSLLFYDKAAYRDAGLPEPSMRWTWEEMANDMAFIVPSQPEESYLTWAYLDTGRNSLFAYAYNWNNDCPADATVRCRQTLMPQGVAAAYDWYSRIAGRKDRMPDLTSLSAFERPLMDLNLQGARRRVAVWVVDPASYEHYLLLAPTGVVPFPGSDRFDGITPLSMRGGFISQSSERPLAVWQWLKYLTHWPTSGGYRLVPSRPSVAEKTNYWAILPRPLGEAMRTAFPFARPITIDEQGYFSWEQLAAVVEGRLSPAEAAQQPPSIKWFQ
jgi:ABC-type glycerol-3-phosphate transport system substrate-binding protein